MDDEVLGKLINKYDNPYGHCNVGGQVSAKHSFSCAHSNDPPVCNVNPVATITGIPQPDDSGRPVHVEACYSAQESFTQGFLQGIPSGFYKASISSITAHGTRRGGKG